MEDKNNVKSFNIKRFNSTYTDKHEYIYDKYRNFDNYKCGFESQYYSTYNFIEELNNTYTKIYNKQKTLEYKPEKVDNLLYNYHNKDENSTDSYNYIEVTFPESIHGLYENSYLSDVVNKFDKYHKEKLIPNN